MIKEAKDLLAALITARVPAATVVRSATEESRAVMARKWPLVTLITSPGTFDEREAHIARYFDEADGNWKERYVRGNRELPILVRCWAEGEAAADELLSRIIPAIPRCWEYDGFCGELKITAEEHSDHTGNTTALYLSVIEVSFIIPAALEETILPTIAEITLKSE